MDEPTKTGQARCRKREAHAAVAGLFGDDAGPAIRTVSVLVPLPSDRPYSYALPNGVEAPPGSIVAVPLGPRTVAGVVWDGPADGVDPKRLRAVSHVFDCPPLRPAMRRFIDWVAAYTLSPPGLVVRMALRSPTVHWKRCPQDRHRVSGA